MQIPETTSERLSEHLNVTMRQLQWWDERHVITPQIRAHRRWYSPQLAAEVAAVAALRRKGASLQMVRKCLGRLRHDIGRETERIAGGADLYLVVGAGARNVLCSGDPFEVGEFADACLGPVIVVRIGHELRRAWFEDGIIRRKR